VLRDLLDSLYGQGFRRFLLVNGHGGNVPAAALVREWAMEHPDAQAIFHSWWSSERVLAAAREVDPEPSHANWFENFPWTRLEGVDLPKERKPPLDEAAYRVADARGLRELLGDGVFQGAYELPDERVEPVWSAGVEEVRELLQSGWR
jgi:creatinine amidohydrolase